MRWKYQVEDGLTVRTSEEGVLLGKALIERGIVVDLTVHREDESLLFVEKGLSTILKTHNGQSLMADNVVSLLVHSTPIGATMAESASSSINCCSYLINQSMLSINCLWRL